MSINKNEITNYINSHDSYKIFDIEYTQKEKECINNFIITNYGGYSSYNTINNLEDFVKNIGDNKQEYINIIIATIKKILDNILAAYNTNSYYIIIRIQGNNSFFDIPRWHCDGYYFSNREKLQTKFVTVLKGNTTLILDTNKEEKDHFYSLQQYKDIFIGEVDDMKTRKHIAENIKGTPINITNNQGIIFVAGNKDKCLIHSEPKMDGNRFFLSILPGTKEDMEYMEKKQKEVNVKYDKLQKF